MDGDQTTLEQADGLRSGHTTTRTSTRTQRVEVITRGERRRRWSIEEKREIVAESLQPGVGPSEVIRKHGISSRQFYTWRQQLTRRLGRERGAPAAGASPACPGVPLIAWSRAGWVIDTLLPRGPGVRDDANVDSRALRR